MGFVRFVTKLILHPVILNKSKIDSMKNLQIKQSKQNHQVPKWVRFLELPNIDGC